MKKILLLVSLILWSLLISLWNVSYAEDDAGWSIIPEWTNWAWESVWSQPWKVWDNYNAAAWKNANASAWKNAWDSFASWVFSWESLFDFFKYLASFLSQIWLVIWAGMVIYSWYKYAVWVFTWDASKWWQDALKWAIYGALIIIFSYAIMKVLLSVFL